MLSQSTLSVRLGFNVNIFWHFGYFFSPLRMMVLNIRCKIFFQDIANIDCVTQFGMKMQILFPINITTTTSNYDHVGAKNELIQMASM